MKTIAVASQKGGSGKTTTAVNLSAALGQLEKRVLLIDLDPQASASNWLGIDGGKDLYEVLSEDKVLSDIIKETSVPGVSLAPSSSWMTRAEKTIIQETGGEKILQLNLRGLQPDRWDFVFIDCPPALGSLVISALTAAQGVIVPVEAHALALPGLSELMKTADVVRSRELNPDLKIEGILACRVDMRTRLAQDVVTELRSVFSDLVYKTVIRENVRLAEAPGFEKSIFQYDSACAGAHDYLKLALELLGTKNNE